MRRWSRSLLVAAAAVLPLVSLPVYLGVAERRSAAAGPTQVLAHYLRAAYARDFHEAYSLISLQDRRLKDERSYVGEQGEFTGFALEVARRLASLIEVAPLEQRVNGPQAHINLKMKLPDANHLSGLVLDWDEDRLNALRPGERRQLLQRLDQLSNENKIPMIDGEQRFDLVSEGGRWRLFFDWAAGTRVTFRARVGASLPLNVKWDQEKVITRAGDLFNVHLRVRNRSDREILTRVLHRVEPKDNADYLDLVECGLLLPARLRPGETQDFSSTYLLRGDLPEHAKQMTVTYEFTDAR